MEPIDTKTVLRYSLAALAIFLITSFLGYMSSITDIQLHTDKVTGKIQIEQVHAFHTYQNFQTTEVKPTVNQDPFVRALIYILLNAVVGLSIMLAGPIMVRFFRIWFGSLLILANNGFAIGEMFFLLAKSFGLMSTLLSVLLHGIFELSAFFLCAGVGLFMGYTIMLNQCKVPNFHSYNEIILTLYEDMKECIKFYCKIILPLFFIAGFIEIFISSRLISLLISK